MKPYQDFFQKKEILNLEKYPVAGFLGEENFWFRQAVQMIMDHLRHKKITIEKTRFHVQDDAAWKDILCECNTLPFLSDQKMILVKNISSLSKTDEKALLKYISLPNPGVILILQFKSMEPRKIKTHKIIQKLTAVHALHESPPAVPGNILRWMKHEETRNGFSLDPEARELFMDACSDSWSTIVQEWEKVILYATRGSCLSPAEIQRVVCFYRTEELDALNRSLFLRQKERALAVLRSHPVTQKNIIPWIGLLRWHLRILIQVASGKTDYEKREILKSNHIYYQNRMQTMIEYARGQSPEEFRRLLSVVMEMDHVFRNCSRALFDFYLERLALKMAIRRPKIRKRIRE